MANTWHIKHDNKTHGPYSGQQLKAFADQGKIGRETVVSKDGVKWVEASKVKGLFPPLIQAESTVETKHAVASLRQKLNEYSNRVPCHSFPNLGDSIRLNDVSTIKVCSIEGTSWIEKRTPIINRMGTTDPIGGRIPKSDDINSIRPWETDLDQPSPPIQTIREHKIPDLEGVDVCDGCRGEGQNGCTTCGSDGQVACPECNRTGEVNCSTCNGSGTMMAQRGIQRQRPCTGEPMAKCVGGRVDGVLKQMADPNSVRICRVCNGTGTEIYSETEQYPVVCTGCAGNRQVACTNCSQAGVVTCSKCSGKTVLTCSTCNGQKHLRHTAVIKQSFTPKRFNQAHICEYEIPADTTKLVGEFKNQPMITGGLESIIDQLKPSTFLVEAVRTEFAKTDRVNFIGDSERVIERSLIVAQARVYRISYSLNNNDYIAFVGDLNCDFTANPITHELAWSLSQNASTSALAKGHKMAKECDECKRIVEAASEGVSSLNKLMARGLSMFTSPTPPVASSHPPEKEMTANTGKPPVKSEEPPSGLFARIKSHPPTLIATICGGLFLGMVMCCCGLGIIGMILDPEGFAEYQRQVEQAEQQKNEAEDILEEFSGNTERVYEVGGIKVNISSLLDSRIKFSKFEKTRTQIKFVVEGPVGSLHYFAYDKDGVGLYDNAVNIEGGGSKVRASIYLGSEAEDVVEVNIQ